MMRGYLWEDLDRDIEVEFYQPHPLDPGYMIEHVSDDLSDHILNSLRGWGIWQPVKPRIGRIKKVREVKQPRVLVGRENWKTPTQGVRELRERRRIAGMCISCDRLRDPRSKSYCTTHRELDRLKAEEKRRRAGKPVRGQYNKDDMDAKKLPRDRSGTNSHFKILVRHEKDDGTVDIRESDGYLHMNVNPDGCTLREIFIRVGKAGGSDALLDEWAKQVSNRLQEGCTVEQVFKTHVGTIFGDAGIVQCVKGISSCTSVLDLISRIVLQRFGQKETTV
jgi:hypothetical protein